jgi:hypothetical protein
MPGLDLGIHDAAQPKTASRISFVTIHTDRRLKPGDDSEHAVSASPSPRAVCQNKTARRPNMFSQALVAS